MGNDEVPFTKNAISHLSLLKEPYILLFYVVYFWI